MFFGLARRHGKASPKNQPGANILYPMPGKTRPSQNSGQNSGQNPAQNPAQHTARSRHVKRPVKRQADFSGFLNETAALLGDGIAWVAVFVAVVGGLNAAWAASGLDNGFAGLLIALAGFVATYLLIAKFLALRGSPPVPVTRIWAYLGLSVLAALGVLAGFMAIIIPGIIVLVRWSAAPGFLIGEGAGITQSLGASWRATRGKGWAIFGAGFLIFILLSLCGAMVRGLFSGSLGSGGIVSGALEATFTAIFAGFGVAIHTLVREDHNAIQEVFS